MKYILMLFIGIIHISCNEVDTKLERALLFSGDNYDELKYVLDYYSKSPKDSLKLKAAEFLIANMPGHYSYYGETLDEYLDSIHHSVTLRSYPWHLRNMFLIQAYRNPNISHIKGISKIEDIHCISSSYLIDNIEKAFFAWQKPWARHMGFDDFCEYLLPYRVDNEPIMCWRDSLSGVFDDVFKRMETVDELFESPYQACLQVNTHLMELFKEMKADSLTFIHLLTGKKEAVKFGCPEFVYAAIFAMRSVGIPVSIESIEQWSSRRGKHYWNAVYHFTGLSYPFTGYDSRPRGLNQDYKMNKVYRHVYALNSSALIYQSPQEPIPPFFQNVFLKDVTEEYMECHDITVQLNSLPEEKREYAYLCVFDNEIWVPVHWGKINNQKVAFTKVGPQTMFIAGYYIDGEIIPASNPFHVNLEGKVEYIIPNNTYQSLLIERKYPLYHRFANYSRHLIGTTIEGSSYPDFHQSRIIATLTHDANTMWDSIFITSAPSIYRYIRFNHIQKIELAELEFYSFGQKQPLVVHDVLLPPEAISDKKESKLFNGSIGDYTQISHWIGFDFGKEIHLEKIKFCPRTDDNHISLGDTYELYMFDDGDFRLLKQQVADAHTISFDSIPSEGLYLLKDATKGNEHRIFTYVNKKTYFW